MKKLNSYILFDGNCKEAMEFYQSIFGAELALVTLGNSPMAGAFPPALHARIVNARLQNDVVDISASDWLMPNATPVRGNMNCLYIHGGTAAETRAVFEGLSKNGNITNPLVEQPFGWYGRLIDAFGVIWMFHADKDPAS